MKKTFFILNVILIAVILVGDIFYIQSTNLIIKGLASFGFVLLGIFNLVYAIKSGAENLKFSVVMVIGLFFAMLGDIVLNIHFIGGALLFAVGHVFYFVAYCCYTKFKAMDLIPSVIIFIVSALLITCLPVFDFKSTLMQIICIVYALIISLMVGKSISNLRRNKNNLMLLLTTGSLLFYFSDLMLVFNNFSNVPPIFHVLCLGSYYPAQCLLSNSIFHTVKKGDLIYES